METPLEMVVLGDSIAWGQGLRDEQKFSARVQRWLSHTLGRPVHRAVYAHSGAVIRPDAESDGRASVHGEIPASHPSIAAQTRLVPRPARTDLILLNGGINDIGFRTLVSPFTTEARIRHQAMAHCGHSMRDLLGQVAHNFPRAVIVVTGYYRVVSAATPVLELARAYRLLSLIGSLAAAPLRHRLAALSNVWHEASTAALEWAVSGVNGALLEAAERRRRRPQIPRWSRATPEWVERVLFAAPPFGPEHCYATRDTYLWRLGDPDPARQERVRHCQECGLGRDRFAVDASAGHPNERGAAAYSAAVIGSLSAVCSRWLPRPAASPDRTDHLPDAA